MWQYSWRSNVSGESWRLLAGGGESCIAENSSGGSWQKISAAYLAKISAPAHHAQPSAPTGGSSRIIAMAAAGGGGISHLLA